MNYERIYNELISRGQQRNWPKGHPETEQHHIIPRSLGGSDEPENLVVLTYREHRIAHDILTKITTGLDRQKMWSARWFMNNKQRKMTSHQYARLRKEYHKNHNWATEESIEASRERNRVAAEAGTHPFQSELVIQQTKERNRRLLESGAHVFQSQENKDLTRQRNENLWDEGRHNFQLHNEKALKNATEACKAKREAGEDVGFMGRKWINNGIEEDTILVDESIPGGWESGRLKTGPLSEEILIARRESRGFTPFWYSWQPDGEKHYVLTAEAYVAASKAMGKKTFNNFMGKVLSGQLYHAGGWVGAHIDNPAECKVKTYFWTNGTKNVKSAVKPGPEFILGRKPL